MQDIREIFDLTGKTALITGGGTGLGRQAAEILAAYGARVVLAARRKEKLVEAAEAINLQGGDAHSVSMDISNSESIDKAFAEIGDLGPVSILVNSAGVVAKPSLLELSEDDWDRVLNINLKGGWLVSRAAARHMIEAETGGSIIHIASMLGFAVQKGTGPYMASKAGLIHLTRNMALEWARYGIRANAIAPGYIMTDLAEGFLNSPGGQAMLKRIPMRRLGNTRDIAGAVLLLASDAGAFMTGSVITADGGQSMAQV